LGFLDIFAKTKHALEIHESMDEILFGHIVAIMYRRGWPIYRIGQGRWHGTDSDKQIVRFRTYGDDVLYSLLVVLDRKTGGVASLVVGNKATLTLVGEVKNFIADPDDIIENLRTDLRNLFKIPLFGNVRINHEFNSIFAQTTLILELSDFVSGTNVDESKMEYIIFKTVDKLKEHLKRYKKPSNITPKF